MADEQNSKYADVDPVQVEKVREDVDAQVAPPREPDADKVTDRRTNISTDVVVTDPSDPLAVIVPPEGSGSLDLPAERLLAPTPEQVFADESEEDYNATSITEDRSDEAPQVNTSDPAESSD